MTKRTAVIGAGMMGETLLAGLVRAGRGADDLLVVEKRAERAAELSERYDVPVVDDVSAAAAADTVLLVVKPQDMAGVLDESRPGPAPRPACWSRSRRASPPPSSSPGCPRASPSPG
ncbi:NAD(P)-binding domain-containing protein [Nocardioides convexus]|uniref:pyrroline-5-carboxylate reductase family protein n=1 Tax=Nocardioides convexus TaxID=2712224 RepID=UPI002418495C|nr:NAD(P)-binding domain-containing protein [Nocardioides convexus]